MPNPANSSGVRLAELMISLSLATDLAMGQPLEFALASSVLAVRLGESLGLDETELREVYYQSLLRYIGCNAETHLLAALFGDELEMRTDFARVDSGSQAEMISFVTRTVRRANPDANALQLAQMVARGLLARPAVEQSFAGHCEVAERLATRLGFSEGLVHALGRCPRRS